MKDMWDMNELNVDAFDRMERRAASFGETMARMHTDHPKSSFDCGLFLSLIPNHVEHNHSEKVRAIYLPLGAGDLEEDLVIADLRRMNSLRITLVLVEIYYGSARGFTKGFMRGFLEGYLKYIFEMKVLHMFPWLEALRRAFRVEDLQDWEEIEHLVGKLEVIMAPAGLHKGPGLEFPVPLANDSEELRAWMAAAGTKVKQMMEYTEGKLFCRVCGKPSRIATMMDTNTQ